MSSSERIYLDNAATSWPKPEPVYVAMAQYLQHCGAPAGRSAYREAVQANNLVQDARRYVAEFMGADDPSRLVFTANGTDSLNLIIHGLLHPGDHVVTSVVEHNSVLRPLRFLEQNLSIQVTRVPCDGDGIVAPSSLQSAIRPNTRLLALTHASNVTGALQPIEEAVELAHARGILVLVDAAQTLGHVPVNVGHLNCDFLAAPAHKGLLGPLGLGVLYLRPGTEDKVLPTRQGGTGTNSEDDRQPQALPERYEVGSHNLPAIAGLRAAISYLQTRGIEDIRKHELALTVQLLEGLGEIRGVKTFGPSDPKQRVGVVSICINGYDPQEAAAALDAACSVQVRSGLHCAPLMHDNLGTLQQGGTVRLSIGPFNTAAQIDVALRSIAELASEM